MWTLGSNVKTVSALFMNFWRLTVIESDFFEEYSFIFKPLFFGIVELLAVLTVDHLYADYVSLSFTTS